MKNKVSTIHTSEVNSESGLQKSSVLGTFTGKCCDTNVFNNNDMHLSRELFEKLMASEEYKRAMENHHYCGYLGHPENSDCQEYEHACIVMKDMRIADNGEIEGDFDLIDTPVGRTVKAFIDAGVNFGISIRGLGEVDSNGEVDPDEFIFRGFDLVTFPAYDDCIPEFKAIAASTDAKKQAKFKKVCAAIDANLDDITDCGALAVIQEQLPSGCDEFNKVQNRIDELNCEVAEDECLDITQEKLDAVTELYLDAAEKVRELEKELCECQVSNSDLIIECKTLKQKQARLNRIVANQLDDAADVADSMEEKYIASTKRLNRVKASLIAKDKELAEVNNQLASTKANYDRQVTANTRLKNRLDSLIQKQRNDQKAIEASDNLNLKYRHKIEAHSKAIIQKDSTIDDLKNKLSETVTACKTLESKASNLDVKNQELLSRVEAAEEMVSEYQQAYANMYANALGVYLTGLPITASTSVEELKNMIQAGTSTANIPAKPAYYEGDQEDSYEDEIDAFEDIDGDYSAGLVTL